PTVRTPGKIASKNRRDVDRLLQRQFGGSAYFQNALGTARSTLSVLQNCSNREGAWPRRPSKKFMRARFSIRAAIRRLRSTSSSRMAGSAARQGRAAPGTGGTEHGEWSNANK